MKSVDLIIPTYKPGEEFLYILAQLKKQEYPISRMIIINTEKKYWDMLATEKELEKEYPNLEIVHITKEEFDHAKTRQMGADLSTADVMVMMTMDAVPKDEQLITKLVEGLEKGQKESEHKIASVAVSYARQLAKKNAGVLEAYTREHNYPAQSLCKSKEDIPKLGIKTYFCSDVCAAYDRKLFQKLGGFVDQAIFNEDMLYVAKAMEHGYGVYYASDALVYHSHNYSGWQQLKRNFDLGVSQAQHPEVFEKVPSESAGIAMVKKTAGYVVKIGKPWLVMKLIWQSGCKYIGYRLGKSYKKLPKSVIMSCTSFPGYWKKNLI